MGLLLAPAVVVVVLGFGYPVVEVLSRTFTDHVGSEGGAFANLGWFFGDATQVKILLRTLYTALAVTAICLLTGYPYAYLLTIVGSRWRAVLLGIAIVSFWQSLITRNYAWRLLLRDNGPINDMLGSAGLGSVSLLGTTTGVLIGMSQVLVPFMILPLYASMRTVDRRLTLAAQTLGASPTGAFWKVYFPLTIPGVFAGTLLVSILSLGVFVTPALLGSPQNAMLSQAIVLQLNRTLDWGHAGAQALVLLLVTLLALAVLMPLARRRLSPSKRGHR
jgi:putative spermidine/putrescine transport system permease protein